MKSMQSTFTIALSPRSRFPIYPITQRGAHHADGRPVMINRHARAASGAQRSAQAAAAAFTIRA